MTNQEAIKIVEDMIESMNGIDVLYAYEQDALNQLINTAKNWDEMVSDIPHWTIDKSYNCEEIGEALHKVAELIGGHGGYMISAEDMRTALEKNS